MSLYFSWRPKISHNDLVLTILQPYQNFRVDNWIVDSQEQLHGVDKSTFSETATEFDSQRPSLSSEATSTTAPLTKQNLKILRHQTMSGNPTNNTNPTTPSKSTDQKSSSAFGRTIEGARQILRMNGMHIESPFDLDKYPQIQEEVDRLLVDRQSEKKRDTSELVTAIRDFGLSNERTLSAKVMPLLQGAGRSVEQQVRPGESKTVVREWSMDRLGENWDTLFRQGSMPVLKHGSDFEDRAFEKMLEDYPKLSTPKPDVLYGPWLDAFSEEEQAVNMLFLPFSSPSERVYHPAFVWEWKGARGDIEEATVQSCRATAAIGYANREFRRAIGIDPDSEMVNGVDMKSLAYAMCIDNQLAFFFVGFYERKGTSVVFRFIKVRRYFLEDPKDLSNLRQDVHNILEWTVGERLKWLKRIIGDYIKRDKSAAARIAGSAGHVASPSGSPAAKKQRT